MRNTRILAGLQPAKLAALAVLDTAIPSLDPEVQRLKRREIAKR
jgi:hypothetical protein